VHSKNSVQYALVLRAIISAIYQSSSFVILLPHAPMLLRQW